jgi:hypothetical protein
MTRVLINNKKYGTARAGLTNLFFFHWPLCSFYIQSTSFGPSKSACDHRPLLKSQRGLFYGFKFLHGLLSNTSIRIPIKIKNRGPLYHLHYHIFDWKQFFLSLAHSVTTFCLPLTSVTRGNIPGVTVL